ncbi:MAG: hypothetical protein QOG71_3902 [Pyrinomonadaceae bacterium]|nr:hypothetical protein [Pyrinomonadaceae bacterium]
MDKEIKKAKKDDVLCIISFTLISSQGKVYEVLHDLTPFEEDHDSESARKMWKPFGLGESDE